MEQVYSILVAPRILRVDTILIDADNNGVGTGWPIIGGVAGVNGVYTSNPNGSAHFPIEATGAVFKSFWIFLFPTRQMKSTIQALKQNMLHLNRSPIIGGLCSFVGDFDPEMPYTDPSRPFGPKVFARMGLSAKLMKVNVQ